MRRELKAQLMTLGFSEALLAPAIREVAIPLSSLAWELLNSEADAEGVPLGFILSNYLERVAGDKAQAALHLINLQPSDRPTAMVTQDKRLYFMQRGGPSGPIKIGISSNVFFRLRAIQHACAEPVSLLAAVPQTVDVNERALHKKFFECRKKGEWFAPTPELLAFIDDIKSHHNQEQMAAA